MLLTTDAILTFYSGLTSLLIAVTFAVIWGSQRQFHLLSFGLSFAAVGCVLILVGFDAFVLDLPWRVPVSAAIYVLGQTMLLAGCLALTGRRVGWAWLAAGGLAAYAAIQAIHGATDFNSTAYAPWFAAFLDLAIAWLFLSRRRQLGNRPLGALFALRGLVGLPWLWIYGGPLMWLSHAADQILMMAVGLALIVTELTRARLEVEAGNVRLREQTFSLASLNAQHEVERGLAVEASRAKSTFLANMSHELRTPLNAVIGFSEMLAGFGGTVEETRRTEYAQHINAAGHHLLDLVNEVLEMARLDAGRTRLELQPVSLAEAARSAAAMTAHQANARGIAFTVDIEEAADRLIADERLLKQILINLLSNAFKFTDAGGRVELLARAEGDRVVVTVRDTGIGIAPADLARLFEPFALVGSASAKARGGMGLGLSITKGLAELHGGSITVESEPGAGTAVRIVLPRGASPAARGAAEPRLEQRP